MKSILAIALAMQGVIALFTIVAPFGFDHRSSWGLDFEDLLMCAGLHALALIVGVVASVEVKRFGLLAAQIAAAILTFVVVIMTK